LTQFGHIDRSGVKISKICKSKMAAAAILKNRKIDIILAVV